MKAKIILLSLLVLLLAGFYWFATHAFVEITIASPPQNGSYTLTKQGSDTSATGSATQTVRRLVRRGSYEFFVEGQGSTGLTIIRTGGFLQTTKTSVGLSRDHARSFVGENPSPCMHPVGNQLLSTVCDDTFDQLKYHRPASAESPTVTIPAAEPLIGLLEGTVLTSAGTVAIVQNEADHTAYVLRADGSAASQTVLTSLNKETTYAITPYLDGFLAIDRANGIVFAYENLKSTGAAYQPPRNHRDWGLGHAVSLDQTIAFIYSQSEALPETSFDNSEGAQAHADEVEEELGRTKTPHSEVVVRRGDGSVRSYDFEAIPLGIRLCATDRLCTLRDGHLRVFDISGDKARFLYELSGISTMERSGKNLLVVRERDVMVFNVLTRQGYVSYDFGINAFCGISPAASGYALCIATDNNKRTALLVDTSTPNTDNIDSLITDLESAPYVKELSVYGRFIHIVPDVGDVIYNTQSGEFEYSPAAINAAENSIAETVEELGIDRSIYTVVTAIR